MFLFVFIIVVIGFLLFAVLSLSAEHVDGRIDAFLDEFGEMLKSMTNEDFKSQVILKRVAYS